MPGLFWTSAGKIARNITSARLKHSPALGLHFRPYDKMVRMSRGGLGTVRLSKHDRLYYYSATTSGTLDAAIPVIVSSNVASTILRFSKRNPMMEVDLRGTLRMIPQTYHQNNWGQHIPKLCLYVSSLLNVEKYISDFTLLANAWTIYHNPKARNIEKRYGYTYCSFNPLDESSIIDATNWVYNYIDDYTRGRGIPLTDFDEKVCRFESAVFPLSKIMDGSIDYSALNSFFRGIDFRQQTPLGSSRNLMNY